MKLSYGLYKMGKSEAEDAHRDLLSATYKAGRAYGISIPIWYKRWFLIGIIWGYNR